MAKAETGRAALDRRNLLKGGVLAAGASALASPASAASASRRGDAVVARADTAVVEIATGKIAGYIRNGIFTFKGLPYGDTTEGANRFRPPQKPKPWTGVRSSRQYGLVAPQDKGTGRLNDEEAFMFQWNDSVEGEDCLRVNVWTPGVGDNRKRPVMVWLHGGGFAAGSGNDLPAFDGENLAKRGDVVVVTLNHRLNLLGYMDLSRYGDRYAQSGNVGMLDIVAALEWVRDNIAVFGGDPGCVTIFGQSGGGAKVGALMRMPAAKGLFHRAIVQSGSFSLTNTPDRSQRLTEMMLAELGLTPATVERLHGLAYLDMRRASEAVLRRANAPMPGGVPDIRRMAQTLNFGPVVDGKVIPPDGARLSADVPMIVGTTLNEFATGINHPEYELMTEAELQARVEGMAGPQAGPILAAFRRRTPQAKPFDLWSRIASAPVRQVAIAQAAAKAAQGGAPACRYWFTWQTPVLDGRPRAFHCAEIPFVFYNMDRCDQMTGGGPRARVLGAAMADTWVQFARTGNPNHRGIPRWPAYTPQAEATMIFDDELKALPAPDRDELAALASA
jgi:para-nitrobenzyl esterase